MELRRGRRRSRRASPAGRWPSRDAVDIARAGRRRARRGARPRRHSSRHQERQHHRQRAAAGQGARLRPRQVRAGAGRTASSMPRVTVGHDTMAGHGARHVLLHVAGAGAGPHRRSALGPLLAGRRVLRDARRPAAVRGADLRRGRRRHPAPGAAGARALQLRGDAGRSTRSCVKALEKSPEMRYQDGARALHRPARRLGTHARRSGASRVGTGPRSSGSLGPGGRRPRTSIAVMTFANITREPVDDWIGSGIAETVTADLKSVPRRHRDRPERRCYDALKQPERPSHESAHDDQFAIEIGRGLGARGSSAARSSGSARRSASPREFVEVRDRRRAAQRQGRRHARRNLRAAGSHRLRADAGSEAHAGGVDDQPDSHAGNAFGGGLRAVLARDDDAAPGHARRAGPRHLDVRARAGHRPGLRRGLGGAGHGLSGQGRVPRPDRTARQGDQLRRTRAGARSRRWPRRTSRWAAPCSRWGATIRPPRR